MEKLCNQCGLPGKFQKLKGNYYLYDGSIKYYEYERNTCNKCQYARQKELIIKSLYDELQSQRNQQRSF